MRQISWPIDIPIIIDASFLLDIQVLMCETWIKNHLSLQGIQKWVLRWWKRPFCFSKKICVTLSSSWVFPCQGGVLSSWSLPERLIRPSAAGNWIFHFLWEISPLSHWVFLSTFPMRPASPTPQGLRSVRHPSKCHPRTMRIRGTIQVRLSFQIDGLLTVFRRNRVILNQWTKRNDRSFKWFPKASLVWSFPIRQEILHVS